MRNERLSVRVYESVIVFAVAAFLTVAATLNLAVGPMTAVALDVAADIVCYIVAAMAVTFGVYNLTKHNRKDSDSLQNHHYNGHHVKMA